MLSDNHRNLRLIMRVKVRIVVDGDLIQMMVESNTLALGDFATYGRPRSLRISLAGDLLGLQGRYRFRVLAHLLVVLVFLRRQIGFK